MQRVYDLGINDVNVIKGMDSINVSFDYYVDEPLAKLIDVVQYYHVLRYEELDGILQSKVSELKDVNRHLTSNDITIDELRESNRVLGYKIASFKVMPWHTRVWRAITNNL